jgi:hypothetical protein
LFILLSLGGTATAQYNNHLRVSEDSMLSLHQANQTFIPAKQYLSYSRWLINAISDNSGNLAYTYYAGNKSLYFKDSVLIDTSNYDWYWGWNSRNAIVPMSFAGKIALCNSTGGVSEIIIVDEKTSLSTRVVLFTENDPTATLSNNSAIVRIPHSDSFWIVVRPFDKDFFCYLIDSSGIVDSNYFATSLMPNFWEAQITFNHKGNILASCIYKAGLPNIYLYDFDKKTGKLSNERPLFQNSLLSGFDFGDLIFSPNDSLLYFTANRTTVFQVSVYEKFADNKPKVILAYTKDVEPYSFMEGSDQKIYVSDWYYGQLGVIDKPNTPGVGCKYNPKWHKFKSRSLSLPFLSRVSTEYYPAFIDIEVACGDSTILTYTGDTSYKKLVFYWGDGDSTVYDRGQYQNGMKVKHLYAEWDTIYPVKLAVQVNDIGFKVWRVDSARIVTLPLSTGLKMNTYYGCTTSVLEIIDSVLFADKALITWGDDEVELELLQKSGKYNRKHTYKEGRFDLKIKMSNNYCFSVLDTVVNIALLPKIQSLFYEKTNDTLCAGQELILADTFENIKSRSINWGDSFGSGTHRFSKGDTTAKFTHQYSNSGFYKVTLFDTSTSDCPVQDSFKVYVRPKPMWEYPLKDTTFCNQFTLTLKTGTQYTVETYNWRNLTDQTSIGTDSVLFWFNRAAIIEASVTNVCGVQQDTMVIKQLTKPHIQLDSVYDACENISLKLDIGNPKNEETYLWSTSETSSDIIIIKAGNHWAKAMNYCGKDSFHFQVLLYLKPKAVFKTKDVCEGDTVRFENKSVGGKTYEWRFGDANGSIDSSPGHVYHISGQTKTYLVTLVAMASASCRDSVTVPVTINAKPNAGFSYSRVGKKVTFDPTDENPTYIRKWYFGDGDSSIETYPIHEYTQLNQMNTYACLRVEATYQCFNTSCKLIFPSIGIEYLKEGSFLAYPNPTGGEIYLTFDKTGTHSIYVFDVFGKAIYSSTASGSTYNFSLPESATGTYLIKVINEQGLSGERVIVVK